jgi:excisionase family DNA binding protein
MPEQTAPPVRKRMWTFEESGEITSTSRTTIQREVRAGRLRSVHVGRKHLIRDEDLQAWIDSLPEHAPDGDLS